MRRRWLLATVPIVLGAATGPASAADPLLAPGDQCPDQSAQDLPAAREKAAMRCLVEWARRVKRLPAVAASGALARSAQMKADLIVRCDALSHAPCGGPWNSVFAKVGFRGRYFENIAAGGGRYGTPRGVMGMWLGSPAHRRAILAEDVEVFGVGLRPAIDVDGISGSVWVLHLGGSG